MKTILIVDDNESRKDVAVILTSELPVKVLVSDNSIDALQVLRDNLVDLLITDLDRPEENGIDFIRRIKTVLPELPIVLFAGSGSATAGISAGAVAGFNKPDLAGLLNFLKRWNETSRRE